ncbi:MAG: VWA domain-containing protein [Candidatus Wallbacteria bacterium]|nr:VWA domain-containing protein [Candidatus Wallbacteria bacterium]
MTPSSCLPGARTLLGAAFVAFALACAPSAPASGLDVSVRKVETDEFPRVRVLFDVKSFDKLPFRKLTTADVRLAEEEVAIPSFELLPYRSGVSIGLVVDSSGSESGTLAYLKEAANHLVEQLAPYDEMAVISFGRVVKPLQQLTSDKRLMRDAIMSLQAYGASALYDGIAVGMHESASGIGRQVVIVVSDGREQDFPHKRKRLSRDTAPHLIAAARHHGIELYTVGVGKKVDHELLEHLARQTGGLYLPAPRAQSLRELFAAIARSFESGFQAVYDSPNIREDKMTRGGLVRVTFQGRSGAAPYRYTMRPKTQVSRLSIQRTAVWKEKFARLRVYTRGERETWLEMEFALKDRSGKVVRQGRTTRDGYGSALGGGMPELLELEPGSYTLELRQPGTDLVFAHPSIALARGRSTDLTFNYSRLVFRRNGSLWYDTEHALGETSDLLDLTIEDLASHRVIRTGPMSVFERPRNLSVWLEDGAYRVRLDNHLGEARTVPRGAKGRRPPAPAPGVEAAVLRNALSAEVLARGGDVLFFDVAYDDFLLDQDPRRVPDELAEGPRQGEEPPMNAGLANSGDPELDALLAGLKGRHGAEPREELAPEKVGAREIGRARSRRNARVKPRALPNTAHDRDAKPKPGRKAAPAPAVPATPAKPKAKSASENPVVPRTGDTATSAGLEGSGGALDSHETSQMPDSGAKPPAQEPGPEPAELTLVPLEPPPGMPEQPASRQADESKTGATAATAESGLPRSEAKPELGADADSPADRALARLAAERSEPARPSGSASSRDESDGSVYVSPALREVEEAKASRSKPATVKPAPQPMPTPPAARPAASEPALMSSIAPELRPALDPLQEEEVRSRLESLRSRAKARRTESPAPAADALARLERLAGK